MTTNDPYPSRIGGEPHHIVRLDPVVYSEWTADAPLTRDQADRFMRDGFLVLDGLFSTEEVRDLKAAAGAALRAPDMLECDTTILEPQSGAVRSVFRIHEQARAFEALAADLRLSDIARFLLDDDVYIHQSRLNYKPGFEGREFYWHSDFETWHTEDGLARMRTVSMSVLLTDNTSVNGPLMLIPGSHEIFVSCIGETPVEHYRQSLRKQEVGVPDRDSLTELAGRGGVSAATGSAGTVILFDCNTLHGSAGNISPYPRSNVFFVYNAVSNAPVAPFAAEKPRPEFLAARRPKPLSRKNAQERAA